MVAQRYQVTRFGTGFNGPGRTSIDEALDVAQDKLHHVAPPYHFKDEADNHPRPEVVRLLRDRLVGGDVGDKFVVLGENYDEPGVAVRIIHDTVEESPLVTEARKFLGQPYEFGKIFPAGPPGPGDCSGLVCRVVENVRGSTLPHLSEGIRVLDSVHRFNEHDESRSGDFIFYHFTDRNGPRPHADDITLVVDDDLQIGARPSKKSVAIFARAPELGWFVEYGRLKD